MAQYLVMGASVRQYLPFDGVPTFDDMSTTDAAYPFAESAVAQGAPLRDLSQRQDGVMGLLNGAFRGNDYVTRVSMAYSLVQSLGLTAQARTFDGQMPAVYDGQRYPVNQAA